LKLLITSRTRSGLVKATFEICSTSIPWALSSTICARLQVTTDPELRRTIANRRLPSSFAISRIRNRSLDTPPPVLVAYDEIRVSDRNAEVVDLRGQGSLMRH